MKRRHAFRLGHAHIIVFFVAGLVSNTNALSTSNETSLEDARILQAKSDSLFKDGHYADAIEPAQTAYSIRERILGPENPETILSLDSLGMALRNAGRYEDAEPLLQRVLKIRIGKNGRRSLEVATSLNHLGGLYYAIRDYARAEDLLRQTVVIREKKLGREHPETLLALQGLATLLSEAGDYGHAEPIFRRVLRLQERVLGSEDRQLADTLARLGFLYINTGDFSKAEPLLIRSLSIREKILPSDHPLIANSLRNIAWLYYETGSFKKAVPLFVRAIRIQETTLGPEHPYTADTLYNLGSVYVQLKKFTEAEPLFLRALAIKEKAFGSNSIDAGYALINLAQLDSAIGRYDAAIERMKRAINIEEKDPNSLVYAESLDALAMLYCATLDCAGSEPLLSRALELRRNALGPQHPDTATSVIHLGVSKWRTGDPVAAVSLLKNAQSMQAKNTAQFLLTGSEARKHAYLQSLVEDASVYATLSVSVNSVDAVELGLNNILQYKGRVLDALSDSVTRLRQSVRPQDRALFETLSHLANEQSVLVYQGPGNLTVDQYQRRITELSSQREKLEADLSLRSAEFRRQISPMRIASLEKAIPEGAALIEWFRYLPIGSSIGPQKTRDQARYVAYVVHKDREPVAVDIGDARDIEIAVHEFRLALDNPSNGTFVERAQKLSNLIFQPLTTHLIGVSHLLMSPDGELNLVPMAALVDSNGDYLAKHFNITYLTSGRDILRQTEQVSTRKAVIVANPDFGVGSLRTLDENSPITSNRSNDLDRGGLIFKPLANTELEAAAIKNLLNVPDSNVLLGSNATERNLKRIESPSILHIATHGFFLNDQELNARFDAKSTLDRQIPVGENALLRSGLALAGANTRGPGTDEDGILTALEVAQLDLRGTQLVVLSACDSGIGEIRNGEGVYGLRRALVLSGAQSQVTTLWKVADEPTRSFMINFYRRLLNGEGRSDALRNTQLDMQNKPEFSHPYYWASFIAIGNWKPLSKLH